MANKQEQLVSVITPVYNAEKYLRETIVSVLNQTYSEIEFLLVNDCSPDKSIEIIKEFNDCRIVLLNNEKNIGAALSRNRAVAEAKGRYIAFVDSDDIWAENKLEKQINDLMDSEYTISYTGLDIIDADGNHIKYQDVPTRMSFNDLLKNTAIATSSVVLDTKKISVPIEMPNRKTGEDYALWLSILKNCGNAIGIKTPLVKYRRTNTGLSKNRLDSFGDLWFGQHIQNGISIPKFLFNYCCFAFNAVKKHYIR